MRILCYNSTNQTEIVALAMIARQAKFLKMVSGKMGMYTHESTNLLVVAGGSVDLVSRGGWHFLNPSSWRYQA